MKKGKEFAFPFFHLKNYTMEYIILNSNSPNGLSEKVNNLINDGWKPVGAHQVVEQHRQNRFRGAEHLDTLIENEYSQTMTRKELSDYKHLTGPRP